MHRAAIGWLVIVGAATEGAAAPAQRVKSAVRGRVAASVKAKPNAQAAPVRRSPVPKHPAAAARSRIVEATVFKDGHVFVRHEVEARTDAEGAVTLEHLAVPVEGSYLPYVKTPGVTLKGVVASRMVEVTRRDAATLAELLLANPGARVRVVEIEGAEYEGQLTGLLAAPGWPLPADARRLSVLNTLPPAQLQLRSSDGERLIPLSRVARLTLIGPITRKTTQIETPVRLRMLLADPAPRVTVGAQYLQKGIRWIPSYRMDLDGQNTARLRLRATVINELVDLENTETRLVIGVPRIFNETQTDAIALQAQPKPLSERFNPDALGNFGGFGGFGGGGLGAPGGGLGAPGGGSPCSGEENCVGLEGAHEDLFYLEPRRLTLKKGETMLLPLGDSAIAYADVYTVDIPFVPEEDPERARGLTEQQRRELADELYTVRAKHQLRLTNTTDQPLTTGPAAVFRDGRLAAHSLVLYTPPGSSSLCQLGDAPELEVIHDDKETGSVPVPPELGSQDPRYVRVMLEGKVTLTNRASRSLPVELTRNVPGNVDTAPGAVIERLDARSPRTRREGSQPWVNRRTGSTRLRWKATLKPGEVREFPYTWHVYRE